MISTITTKRILFLLLGMALLFAAGPATAQDGGEESTTPLLGATRTEQAMAHLSTYLELETPISIQRIEDDDENIPYVTYSFTPVTYLTSAMGCPAAGITYDTREVPAYRILITAYGYGTYDYRVDADGRAVILCRGGGPNETSIGLDLANGNALGYARVRTGSAAGLVGGPARVDQAMRHVSGYLNLRNTLTLERVTASDPYIAPTEYAWLPIYYIPPTSNNVCLTPLDANTYNPAAVFGFQVTLTVNNRDYLYQFNQDGSLLILCINGRPSSTSIFPAS